MSKLNLTTLTNSISDPVTLINQNLTALSGALFFANPTLISVLPTTPIVGNIYLVTSAASSPLTPGDVLLYLAATATGYTTFTPLDGAVAGNYIRSTTSSISTWSATASGGGGIGDMLKSVYDINLNGIVDDSEKLGGQLPSYYLSRSLSPWSVKTANYTALAGDRLRLDATASDIVITLPSTPSPTDPDIFIQRLDLSTFKVLLRTGANKINSLSSQDGLFAPATINLIEGVSYVNGSIGWLNQHNRLTFQTYIAPGAGINLTYATDGDTNGLFYYFGTSKRTVPFVNSQSNGTIAAVASSVAFGSILSLSNRIDDEFDTDNLPNSWVAFNIINNSKIAISKYTIRSRPSNASQQVRSWTLEGANTVGTFDIAGINAATWTPIDTRVNDATLVGLSQYYTLTANGSATPFSYLRFRQTGANNFGANYLVLNELEFYGVLT